MAIPRKGQLGAARQATGHARGFRRLVKWRTGCEGRISHLKPVGETAGVRRFGRSAQFAMHASVALIPVWSGNATRQRLNRGGNRQLNAAIHRVAVTQLRAHRPAQALVARRMAAGWLPATANPRPCGS